MLKFILSTILLLGFVGCDDGYLDSSCGELKVNAGLNKTATVNEAVLISGIVIKRDGEISEYRWVDENNEVLSTLSSFSYVPTTVGNHVLTFIVTDDNGCEASDKMTLTVKPLSVDNSGYNITTTTQTQQNYDGTYSWTNGELKATVTSLKKTGQLITLGVVYENVSSEDIKFGVWYKTHLLDENGAIWKSIGDTAGLYKTYRTILPSRKIVTQIKFKAKTSQNGTKFDLILNAYYDDFDHRILGIPVNLGN